MIWLVNTAYIDYKIKTAFTHFSNICVNIYFLLRLDNFNLLMIVAQLRKCITFEASQFMFRYFVAYLSELK